MYGLGHFIVVVLFKIFRFLKFRCELKKKNPTKMPAVLECSK